MARSALFGSACSWCAPGSHGCTRAAAPASAGPRAQPDTCCRMPVAHDGPDLATPLHAHMEQRPAQNARHSSCSRRTPGASRARRHGGSRQGACSAQSAQPHPTLPCPPPRSPRAQAWRSRLPRAICGRRRPNSAPRRAPRSSWSAPTSLRTLPCAPGCWRSTRCPRWRGRRAPPP